MKSPILAACFALLGIVPTAFAQETAPALAPVPKRLSAVSITESKIPTDTQILTQSTTILDEEELSRLPSNQRNLSESLRYQPGVFVAPLSRNDANWGSTGGLGPKYSGYLLDGLPIDGFVDAMSLSLGPVERVEIQKGPAAVMYSNYLSADFAGQQSPLAGVTNFVLRDRIDAEATRLQVGAGSYQTLSGLAYHQGRAGKLHYFFGTDIEKSDYTNYGASPSWLNMQKDPAYLKSKVYGKATYFLGGDGHKVSLFLHHSSQAGDVGRYNRDFNNAYDLANADYAVDLSQCLGAHLRVGLRNYQRRWGEDNFSGPTGPANQSSLREHDGVNQRIIPVDLSFDWKHGAGSGLTFGTDGQWATYRTYAEVDGFRERKNDASASSLGVYAQERFVLGNLVLRAGGRVSRLGNDFLRIAGETPGIADQQWTRFLGAFGIRYTAIPSLAVFANAGNSFVPPGAKSVAGTIPPTTAGQAGWNGQLPNSNLKPESGLSADFGVEAHPLPALLVKARGFMTRVTDQIVDVPVSSTPSQSQSQNLAKVTSVGGELSLQYQINTLGSVFANGTMIRSRGTNDCSTVDCLDTRDNPVPFVPAWTSNAGATLRLPARITVSPYMNFVGTYYDSASTKGRKAFGKDPVFSLKATKTFLAPTHAVDLSLVLNNLANHKYDLPWQFRDPGFNAMAYVDLRI